MSRHPAWPESYWCSSVFSMLLGSHGTLGLGRMTLDSILGPTSRHLIVPLFLAVFSTGVSWSLIATTHLLTKSVPKLKGSPMVRLSWARGRGTVREPSPAHYNV